MEPRSAGQVREYRLLVLLVMNFSMSNCLTLTLIQTTAKSEASPNFTWRWLGGWSVTICYTKLCYIMSLLTGSPQAIFSSNAFGMPVNNATGALGPIQLKFSGNDPYMCMFNYKSNSIKF